MRQGRHRLPDDCQFSRLNQLILGCAQMVIDPLSFRDFLFQQLTLLIELSQSMAQQLPDTPQFILTVYRNSGVHIPQPDTHHRLIKLDKALN